MMKKPILRAPHASHKARVSRLFACLLALCLLLLPVLLSGCAAFRTDKDDAAIVGIWRMTSYTTDKGTQADIGDHELDTVFYSTGVGVMKIDGETNQMFDYVARGGKLTRTFNHDETQTSTDTYTISADGLTLTIVSPDNGATIVMRRIPDDSQTGK